MGRVFAGTLVVLLAVALATPGARAAGAPRGSLGIFADAFESGSDCAWSAGTTPLAPPLGLGLLLATLPPPPGALAGSCLGPGGDLVYALAPTTVGILRISLQSDADLGFYLRDACFGGAELVCVDAEAGGGAETGELALLDTSTIFLVVDSHDSGGDFTLALALCGDDQVEPGEVCDGLDLNGQTCQGLGFSGGVLACQPDCLTFDVSSCIP